MIGLSVVANSSRTGTRAVALLFASVCALAASLQAAHAATLADAAFAPVRTALAAIDARDAGAFATSFANGATILDEISPFSFAGPGAPRAWFARLANVNRDNAIVDEHATVGEPRASSVVGDAAYVVVPVHIAYRQRGKDVVENGAWTFALRNTGGRWKIVSAAFAPATP